jgi:ankyrin repeat protein
MEVVMSKSLPGRPNLEHLRNQAKALLTSWKNHEPDALERVGAFRFAEGAPPSLARAQLVVAREYGFVSWPKLKASLEAKSPSLAQAANELAGHALIDLFPPNREREVQRLLELYPEIETFDLASACILGNASFAEEVLRQDPEASNRKTGTRDWPPLLYCVFSWFLRQDGPRKEGVRQTVRLLLERGADPNAGYAYNDGSKLSALYGAAGVARDPETVRMLLDAGADPNDGESFYHGVESPGTLIISQLFARGASAASKSHAVFRKLDYDDLETFRWLLSQDIEPNIRWEPDGSTMLHQAISRGRSIAFVETILEHGTDPNLANKSGLTPLALAIRRNRAEIAQVLRLHGAKHAPRLFDEWVERALAGQPWEGRLPDFDQLEGLDKNVLADLAGEGNVAGVAALLDAGFPIRLGQWSTPLHWACWKGQIETARLLVERGAPVDELDPMYKSSPLGWTCHGSVNCREAPPENYVEIAAMLAEAGAKLPAADDGWWQSAEFASDEMRAWLLKMV